MPILGVIASSVAKGLAFGLGATYGANAPYQQARSFSMVYGNGLYLMQSTATNKIMTSSNTTTWNTYTPPTPFDTQTQIGFDGTYFWNSGTGTGNVFNIWYSTNGATWTNALPATSNMPGSPSIGSFWAGKGQLAGRYYIRCSGDSNAMGMISSTSLTGTWTYTSNGTTNKYWGCKNNGSFTMMLQNGGSELAYATSPSGTWNVTSRGASGNGLESGVSGSRMFTDITGGVAYSTNGASWTQVSVTPTGNSEPGGACSGNGSGVISTGWYKQRYWYSTNNGDSWAEASTVVQTGSQAQCNSEYAGSYIWLCSNNTGLWRMDPSTPQTATKIDVSTYNKASTSGAQWTITNGSGIVLFGGSNSDNSGYPQVVKLVNGTTSSTTTPAGLTQVNGAGYQATWDGTYFNFAPYYSTEAYASTNGTTWSSYGIGINATVMISNGSKIVAYSQGSTDYRISNLYPNWAGTPRTEADGLYWGAVDSTNRIWMIVQSGTPRITVQDSPTGNSFSLYTVPSRDGASGTWNGYKCYSGGGKNFLIGKDNGSLEIKAGGVTGNGGWTNTATPFTSAPDGVAYGDGYYLVWKSDKMYKTVDFSSYTLLDKYPTNDNWPLNITSGNASGSVIYDGSKWSFINGSSTQIYTQV